MRFLVIFTPMLHLILTIPKTEADLFYYNESCEALCERMWARCDSTAALISLTSTSTAMIYSHANRDWRCVIMVVIFEMSFKLGWPRDFGYRWELKEKIVVVRSLL